MIANTSMSNPSSHAFTSVVLSNYSQSGYLGKTEGSKRGSGVFFKEEEVLWTWKESRDWIGEQESLRTDRRNGTCEHSAAFSCTRLRIKRIKQEEARPLLSGNVKSRYQDEKCEQQLKHSAALDYPVGRQMPPELSERT